MLQHPSRPEPEPSPALSDLLARWCRGDGAACAEVFERLYPDLKRLARRALRRGAGRQSLQTTDVVHEAFLRLQVQHHASYQNQDQLCAVASLMMRRLIVDRIRARQRQRRGGGRVRIDLGDAVLIEQPAGADALAVGDAIARLEGRHPRPAAVITMRFFGGMTVPAVAHALALSISTVEADARLALAWLRRELDNGQ